MCHSAEGRTPGWGSEATPKASALAVDPIHTAEPEHLTAAKAPARLEAFIARWMEVIGRTTRPLDVLEDNLQHLAPEHLARVDDMRTRLHGFVRSVRWRARH